MLNVAYHYMDLSRRGAMSAKGAGAWVRRRDEYHD